MLWFAHDITMLDVCTVARMCRRVGICLVEPTPVARTELRVRGDLACGVQTGSGVVEVDLPVRVEASVLVLPQMREGRVRIEVPEAVHEVRLGTRLCACAHDAPNLGMRSFGR